MDIMFEVFQRQSLVLSFRRVIFGVKDRVLAGSTVANLEQVKRHVLLPDGAGLLLID